MTKYLLIKYSDNYSDEFDVEGFKVMTQDEWKAFREQVQYGLYPYDYYIGTNELIQYADSQRLLDALTPVSVGSNVLKEILLALGKEVVKEFGFFPSGPELPIEAEENPTGKQAFCSYCQTTVSVVIHDDMVWNSKAQVYDTDYMLRSHYYDNDAETGLLCMGSNTLVANEDIEDVPQ